MARRSLDQSYIVEIPHPDPELMSATRVLVRYREPDHHSSHPACIAQLLADWYIFQAVQNVLRHPTTVVETENRGRYPARIFRYKQHGFLRTLGISLGEGSYVDECMVVVSYPTDPGSYSILQPHNALGYTITYFFQKK